jgi:hypothetical protein
MMLNPFEEIRVLSIDEAELILRNISARKAPFLTSSVTKRSEASGNKTYGRTERLRIQDEKIALLKALRELEANDQEETGQENSSSALDEESTNSTIIDENYGAGEDVICTRDGTIIGANEFGDEE